MADEVVGDEDGLSVDPTVATVVGTGRTVAGVAELSPHAMADAVRSNVTTTRRIELFTLAVIVIG